MPIDIIRGAEHNEYHPHVGLPPVDVMAEMLVRILHATVVLFHSLVSFSVMARVVAPPKLPKFFHPFLV